MFARAKVKLNMTAQLPEEMDLYKDEIVNIIEEVEKGWYRGECNGRLGIFPASFVTVLSESSTENCHPVPVLENNASDSRGTYDNAPGYSCINSGITPYGRALYPFEAEYPNELSLKGDEIVNIIKHVDSNWIEGEVDGKTGIFPATFINIIVDCPKTENSKMAESFSSVNEADINTFPPDTYGRVISDFYPQLEGDIRLREGDTVTLIRKIDQNWYEVETDSGESSVCPESYIEVIGSGPPSYSEVMASLGAPQYNSSLIDIDSGFLDDSKSSSKSNRPLSFVSTASDSSFSSQNGMNDITTKGTNKFLDDNATKNLAGLESNNLFSTESSFNGNLKSYGNYDNFGSHSFKEVDFLSSTNNSSPRNLSFSSTSSPKQIRATTHDEVTIPRIDHTPARPPPPVYLTLSESMTNFNNSFTSPVNSSRQSISSTSSHSSSDSAECNNESDIQNQIKNKEQILKQRINCLNKLEIEVKNTQNRNVSSELRTQISQLNEDIERIKGDIEVLNAKLKPKLCRTVSDQSGSDDRQMREEEVTRKKAVEQKRRDEEKK